MELGIVKLSLTFLTLLYAFVGLGFEPVELEFPAPPLVESSLNWTTPTAVQEHLDPESCGEKESEDEFLKRKPFAASSTHALFPPSTILSLPNSAGWMFRDVSGRSFWCNRAPPSI